MSLVDCIYGLPLSFNAGLDALWLASPVNFFSIGDSSRLFFGKLFTRKEDSQKWALSQASQR